MKPDIRSTSNKKLKLLKALARSRNRDKHGLFLAEGPRIVEELLTGRYGRPREIYLDAAFDSKRFEHVRALAEPAGTPVAVVDSNALGSVTDTVQSQGVCALAAIPRPDPEQVLARTERLILLDGVQDPGNVGTLVRLAEGTGVGGVLVLPGTCDPFSPKAVRASAGGIFHLPVIPCTDARAVVTRLRNHHYTLAALTPRGTPYWNHLKLLSTGKTALAAGNEGAGLSPAVERGADVLLSIPMAGRLESLNVAVSTGMILMRLLEERQEA